MNPETKKCGICHDESHIGLSIYCWPENETVHICVTCCVLIFPTYLSMEKKGIVGKSGVQEIVNDIVKQTVEENMIQDYFHFDPMSDDFNVNVSRWINESK